MKITARQLRAIISEEISRILREPPAPGVRFGLEELRSFNPAAASEIDELMADPFMAQAGFKPEDHVFEMKPGGRLAWYCGAPAIQYDMFTLWDDAAGEWEAD